MTDSTDSSGAGAPPPPGTDPTAGTSPGPASSAPASDAVTQGKDAEIQHALDHLSDIEAFLDDALDIAVGAVEAEGTSVVANPGLLTSALDWVPAFARPGVQQFLAATVNKQLTSLGGKLDASAKAGLSIGLVRVRAILTAIK